MPSWAFESRKDGTESLTSIAADANTTPRTMRNFLLVLLLTASEAFLTPKAAHSTRLYAQDSTDEDRKPKAAKLVTGAELEVMLTEWDKPLVVDAYASTYG